MRHETENVRLCCTVMASHLMKHREAKNISHYRGKQRSKKRQQFSLMRSCIEFLSSEQKQFFVHKAAADVPLTLIMNHLFLFLENNNSHVDDNFHLYTKCKQNGNIFMKNIIFKVIDKTTSFH